MLNDINNIDIQNIILISKNVKIINIVTNNMDKLKKTEDYLYNELGIIINISNNKQKSLLKAKLIINYDFPEELVNKYNINDNAIIINMLNKIDIKSKRFNGININYFKLSIPNKYHIYGFRKELIYESLIYNKEDLKQTHKQMQDDKIKIKGLIGNNGIINEKEFN